MSFSHLKPEKIREIKKFFTDNELEYNAELRSLMLDKINFEYQQGLKNYSTNYYQLSGDLNSLNSLKRLGDETVPLQIWLQNGLDNLGPLEGKAIFEQSIGQILAGPVEVANTEAIIITFEKLSELIQSNEFAKDVVKFYKKIFEDALKEFKAIADYKALHDALHQLQLVWPDITPFLDRLNTNPELWMTVLNYSSLLETTIVGLRKILDNKAVKPSEKVWIDALANEQVEFGAVLNQAERTAIEEAFHRIKSHILERLSLLNTSLKEAIRDLQLSYLINAMRDVCNVLEELAVPELTAAQLKEFNKGVDQMSVLDEELTKLIIQHDEWQKMDTMLHSFGDVLGVNAEQPEARSAVNEEEKLGNLRFILSIIEKRIAPLLEAKPTRSSAMLKLAADNFKSSIEKKDTDMAERWFVTYRDQAWHYFFDLDAEMKARCDRLKLIGDELSNVNKEFTEE